MKNAPILILDEVFSIFQSLLLLLKFAVKLDATVSLHVHVFEDVLKRALIMLQATSALDSVSERLVQGALDRLMKVRAIALISF